MTLKMAMKNYQKNALENGPHKTKQMGAYLPPADSGGGVGEIVTE